MRTVLLGAAAVGVGYVVWRRPATQRFVATVREAATRREAELREAVELAVTEDATTRAPRHAADARVPDLDVDAGWDRADRSERSTRPALGGEDPGRSLSPDEARALLLDPSGPSRADRPDGGRAR
ncbi:hypothetical protein G7075_07690 [Phycicoccus sp. HDW14]|uniref:hypothetical protein n=1 Tax=Phycicoccus sp. HDW14 TaxID=2714941 RepID=UPI001409BD5C|nr:hypothetical protein [Phycicoccus sp. HDW14]QIM21042.1 hypothetical protein G7075_07690 [Phycicoccus sp. HDW14]